MSKYHQFASVEAENRRKSGNYVFISTSNECFRFEKKKSFSSEMSATKYRLRANITWEEVFRLFSRVHATLQVTVSVCRSVGRSVGRSVPLCFFLSLLSSLKVDKCRFKYFMSG